ncbi:MAG: PPC domain-containing protein [Anaerolineae bacterium]
MKRLQRLMPILLLIAMVGVLAVHAQEGRSLTSGTPVATQLDATTFIQVFTVQANAGDVLDVTAANPLGIPLAVGVTDTTGAQLGQLVGDLTGTVNLQGLTLPAAGTYYVTVIKAPGVSATASEQAIQVTLTATLNAAGAVTPEVTTNPASTADVTSAPVSGQLVTTLGMTISLTWATTDDLDIEVRDPVGGSLYFQTPTVDSGGTLGPNVNQGCANTTQTPSETATWSPGGIPTGSYELLVYYQQACDGDNPVEFTIAPTVDGVAIGQQAGTVNPGQVYVTSFVINADGTAAFTGLSGIADDQVLPDVPSTILANATPITIGTAVSGTIASGHSYDAYSFEVATSDIVTIAMAATTGSLDTFLALLDPAGNVIRTNDDQVSGVTDSQISNALLTTPGTYTIVASRYGKNIGGTEGTYTLLVTTQASNLPAEYANRVLGSLEFTLLWNTDDDLQLLVRDPAGAAVYDDTPTIRSGGTLGANGNVNCTPAASGTPFSYIYWPVALQPRPGVYEVEVWFQSECSTTNPVDFNLFATYNGREIFNVNAQPLLNERYLISFTLNADGTVTVSDGGIARGLETLPYQADIENALPIAPGGTQNGAISQDNKFDLYMFDGTAGDIVNIAMNASSGTLDPTLYVVGPFGNEIASNDDAVAGENRNSLISNLTLPETGQYIIIATHFGALYGGTSGTYTLTLTPLN